MYKRQALALANNTSVKFNTIATTRTDGYKVFTDTQIAEGFKMTFNGKDALFGEKMCIRDRLKIGHHAEMIFPI